MKHLMESYRVSQRRACGLLEGPRSSFRYESQRDDSMLREKLIGLARERPRFGYRRLHILLQRGGVSINHKRVWRVYKAAGLSVKPNTPEEVDSQPATRVAVARGESGVGRRFCQRCDERRPNISGTERGGHHLAGFGLFLREGQIVLTGSPLPLYRVAEGDRIEVNIPTSLMGFVCAVIGDADAHSQSAASVTEIIDLFLTGRALTTRVRVTAHLYKFLEIMSNLLPTARRLAKIRVVLAAPVQVIDRWVIQKLFPRISQDNLI